MIARYTADCSGACRTRTPVDRKVVTDPRGGSTLRWVEPPASGRRIRRGSGMAVSVRSASPGCRPSGRSTAVGLRAAASSWWASPSLPGCAVGGEAARRRPRPRVRRAARRRQAVTTRTGVPDSAIRLATAAATRRHRHRAGLTSESRRHPCRRPRRNRAPPTWRRSWHRLRAPGRSATGVRQQVDYPAELVRSRRAAPTSYVAAVDASDTPAGTLRRRRRPATGSKTL